MPELDYALGRWLHARMYCCLWDDIQKAYKRVLTEVSNRRKVATPFSLLSIPSTPSQQKIAAETYTADNFPPIPDVPALSDGFHPGRIRIGYFSGNFRDHAVAHLIAQLFELHDRSQFAIFGFSFGPSADDDMRRRLTAGLDELIDVEDRSDKEVADLARNLQIDIAVDLMGFTEQSRTGIFAHRAAPIQVNYNNYLDLLLRWEQITSTTLLPTGSRSRGFKGSIAHVGIWNRLLSSTEITSIWTAGQSELRSTAMYRSYV